MDRRAAFARRALRLTTTLPLLAALGMIASRDAKAQQPTTQPQPTQPPPASGGGGLTFGASADTSAPPAVDVTATGGAATTTDAAPAPDEAAEAAEWAERDRMVNEVDTLTGGVGLLRTKHAESGAPGQFRLGFTTEWFSAGFLCSTSFPCPPRAGGTSTSPVTSDSVNHIGATISLGISIAKLGSGILEGYASTGAFANSDDQNRPSLLQVLGDTNFGIKYGAPLSKIFWLGGFAELWLVNGTGSVGLDGSGTGAKFGPIATLDLRQTEKHTPLRFSLNAYYSLDNTGDVLTSVEAQRGHPVTRIERFGLNVNRVDFFDIRAGGEFFAAEERVRPFIEYAISIPNNRQGYACKTNNPSHDNCLANDSIAPSKLTFGGRFFPWKRGFSLLAALDVGLTGTSDFIEEESPTPPWTLFIGAGWNVDTQERPPVRVTKTVVKNVEVSKKLAHVMGLVHEGTPAVATPPGKTPPSPPAGPPVAGAVVAYKDHTSLYTGADGKFTTDGLPDGDYSFDVTAEGYKPGTCKATITKAADTQADCALEALPKVGNVVGTVRDAATGAPLANVTVKMLDAQKNPYNVSADANGNFKFVSVPPGTIELQVQADGYLAYDQQVQDIKPRTDNHADVQLQPQPKNANVELTNQEIKIKQQVQFATGSAVIKPESFGLLTEVADVIIRHPELKQLEVQGHTDNVGPADYNKQLSQERAEAVRLWLTQHGVDGSRLVAKGYGQDKPLVPNVTEAFRQKNRRVQFVILQQDKSPPAGR